MWTGGEGKEYVGNRGMRTVCGREEKERKTEAEVDGQCKCELEGEGDSRRVL